MKKVFTIFIAIIALSIFAQATSIEVNTYSAINKYWESADALTSGNNAEYQKAFNAMNNELDKLAEEISNDSDKLKEFSEVYKTLPEETKHIFNSMISEIVVTRAGEELFPGYGYAEPGFYYRKGAEEKKELLQKYWKSEERTFEKNSRHKFYVELKLSTSMNQSAEAGGKIDGFDVKGVFGMEINGEFKQVAEVEFSSKDTLKTKCVVAYEKNKVWYELYKAPKGFWDFLPWTSIKWQKAGSTYVVVEEATETSVMVEVNNL
ncbi:MAG: hypothetical protein M0R46_11755 [Candidatus Muirbacterium halophilum]|nr:hypothetical protein [Candidatus Muirbacterium halophilum]MCK9476589.1 hypothetical protein [Candidatus Muirbacterium halophilum]